MRISTRTLQIAVILGAASLLGIKLLGGVPFEANYSTLIQKKDHARGRNERSTPRSFVLPATPAVALAQEAMKDNGFSMQRLLRCVSVLRTLGYDIEGDENLLNAKVVEAIYTFQKDRDLNPSGKLDFRTMRALKCL